MMMWKSHANYNVKSTNDPHKYVPSQCRLSYVMCRKERTSPHLEKDESFSVSLELQLLVVLDGFGTENRNSQTKELVHLNNHTHLKQIINSTQITTAITHAQVQQRE